MENQPKDMTVLPDLSKGRGRVGPVRERKPIYLDLMPPCNNACPAGENIQEWLRLVKIGKPEEAWRQIVQDNPFPAIHGRVCYHPCESACNRGDLDSAISIRGVERFLGDLAIEQGWQYPKPQRVSGHRVMVVGSGPSGLSAAYHLTRLGHEVEIFDAGELPGGMMRYGIPEYRLPRDILDSEIQRLKNMGVKFNQNHPVKDLLKEQRDGNFDAVFVAVGAHISKRVDIPSMDASKVVDAVSFLRDVASGERPIIGRRVAVYGGGNTAMDAARVARRLGAEESVVVYRRTEAQMPAHEEERTDAEAEGVKMNWLRTITEMEESKVTVEIMELDENGQAVGTGKFETLEADTVILALGQRADTEFLKAIPGMSFHDDVVDVDPDSLMTAVPGIFAGGDAVPSDRTVTIGTGHGKKAAKQIDAWLNLEKLGKKERKPVVALNDMNVWYFGEHGRTEGEEIDADERIEGFGEIVGGLTAKEAKFEAGRCLSCGNCFECDGCYGSCPEDAVIKLGPGNRYRFDYERCTGCATCYEQCPVHAIQMIPEGNR